MYSASLYVSHVSAPAPAFVSTPPPSALPVYVSSLPRLSRGFCRWQKPCSLPNTNSLHYAQGTTFPFGRMLPRSLGAAVHTTCVCVRLSSLTPIPSYFPLSS